MSEPAVTPMTELWRQHRAALRGYIARRVREADAVDDILQEVFLKAYTGLHAVKSPGSVAAWLYRIAAHAVADHYRARRPVETLPEQMAAPAPERDAIAELAACLQPLIDRLPATYRTALVMSEIDGLPQREVADRLGLSLSGAKSRVQRGREHLRRLLTECCDIEIGRRGVVAYERREEQCAGGCAKDCG
jgi:RNA polymerase sigma-70 factor (ECF subfamily)